MSDKSIAEIVDIRTGELIRPGDVDLSLLANQGRAIIERTERDAWELGKVAAMARTICEDRGMARSQGYDGPNPDARFGAWCAENFRTHRDTILNARQLWQVFGHRKEEVEHIPRSGLYLLAAPSLNEADREELLKEYAETVPSVSEIKQHINERKKRERRLRLATGCADVSDHEWMPTLICGDAIKEMAGLTEGAFDLICVDPPYNVDKADWDSFGSGADFADWAEGWLQEAYRLLKPSGAIYVFGVNRMLSHIQHRMDAIGFRYRNWITWDTIQGAGGGLWVNRSESILYYSRTGETFEDTDAVKLERHEEHVREYQGKEYRFKNPSNVWRFPCVDERHPERTGHPTQKPVELIERIVLASCPEGGTVLDCFIGSGTTGVACMKTRRRCVGIDASREYLQIAKSRFGRVKVAQ